MHPVVVEQAFFRYNFISNSDATWLDWIKKWPDQRQAVLKIRLWIYGGLGLPHNGSLSSMSIKKAAVPKDQAVDLRRKRQDVYLAAEFGKSFFDNRIWKRFD